MASEGGSIMGALGGTWQPAGDMEAGRRIWKITASIANMSQRVNKKWTSKPTLSDVLPHQGRTISPNCAPNGDQVFKDPELWVSLQITTASCPVSLWVEAFSSKPAQSLSRVGVLGETEASWERAWQCFSKYSQELHFFSLVKIIMLIIPITINYSHLNNFKLSRGAIYPLVNLCIPS